MFFACKSGRTFLRAVFYIQHVTRCTLTLTNAGTLQHFLRMEPHQLPLRWHVSFFSWLSEDDKYFLLRNLSISMP